MKKYFLSILISLVCGIGFSNVNAVTYPTTYPSGEATGGIYNTYFDNMFAGPCSVGLAIVGFSTGGVLQCLPISSATTSGFTGSLIGTEFYIPRYTTAGTGMTISQLYDAGTIVYIGTGAGALPVTNGIRVNVMSGDILVNDVRIGQGPGIWGRGNTVLGDGGVFASNISGWQNTVLGFSAGNTITTGTNNIAIGFGANVFNGALDNQLNIGNWIYGSNGNIGIGNPTPGAKLDILGTVKIVDGSEGNGKVLVSDASGLASWQGFVSGSTATGIISGAGTAHYLSKFGIGGTGIYPSQLFESGANIGLGTTNPAAKLDVIGNVKITDGTQGIGKILASDASGRASWQNVIAGNAYATGIIIPPGSNNYLAKFDSTGSGIVASVVYENLATGNIGIGTNTPGAKLEIDSGIADTSGLRFTRLNTLSPLTATGIVSVGINSSGDIVAISPVSNIAVYTATSPLVGPQFLDVLNTQISYDFNHYFAIDTKQSFVVSKGDSHGNNAPFFSENAISSNCSKTNTGSYSPLDCEIDKDQFGVYATPDNSFTISARGDTYGYQLALGARGDAPLFARSGRFSQGGTGGLFLPDGVTPSFWSKILAFPANHPEYLYVNTGYDSQLVPQAGGGQVAIGTTRPNSRFEIWTGASTAPLMHFRGDGNVALGLYALNTPVGTGVITAHSKNTAIGYGAGSGMINGSNNIYIGSEARPINGASSNTLNIGNTIFGNNLPTTFGGVPGNIGIGTNNPAYKLSVNGTIQAADFGGYGTENIRVGDDTYLSDLDIANTIGIFGVQNNNRAILRLGDRPDQEISTNGGGSFGIDALPTMYKLTVGGDVLLSTGWFRTTGNAGWYNQTYAGGWFMQDSTWLRSYNEKSVWTGTGLLGSNRGLSLGYGGTSPSNGGAIIRNNVAIGSSAILSPNVMLSISGSVANTGAIQIRDGQEGADRILVSDANGIGMWRDVGASSIDWHVAGNTGVTSTGFIGTIDSADLVFKTFNTERLRLTSTGGLGIGTSTPGSYLLYNSGTSYFADNIDIRPTKFIRFQNTSVLNQKSGISWANDSVAGTGLTSIYVDKTGTGKNSYTTIMDSPNNFDDEFVWIHDRTGTGFDSTPMRLSANYGDFYNGAMRISKPYSGGYQQVGFGVTPSTFGGGTPRVEIDGKIRIADTSQGAGKVLVSDVNGVATWVALAASTGTIGYWKTVGNTGTTSASNFVGTSDAVSFVIKANSQEKIFVEHNTSNLRIGGDMMLGRGRGNILGNTALGSAALGSNTIGSENTAVGFAALYGTIASENTAIGYEALSSNSTGSSNTAIGNSALTSNIGGSNNTAIGMQSLFTSNAGDNTAVGYGALYSNRGMNNTALGYNAGRNLTTGNGNIVIGYGVNLRSNTADDQLNIGNWIYGTNGNIGIGTNNPSSRLHVNGNSLFNGTISIRDPSAAAGRVLTSDAVGNAVWANPTAMLMGGTTNYMTRWISPTTLGIGSIYDNGNVGINTNSPQQALDVNGNIVVRGISGYSIYTYSGSNADWRIGMSSNPGYTRSLATSWNQYATFNNSVGNGFSVGSNGSLSSFEVTGAAGGYNAFFRGNVGFGTASPSEKIHIAGKIRIQDGSQASGAILTSNGSGVGTWVVPDTYQQTEWIYRNQSTQPNTSNASLADITDIISRVLPINTGTGYYEFEVLGKYTSNSALNGISLGLKSNCGVGLTNLYGSATIGMGNGTSYVGLFSDSSPVISTGVSVASTEYPFTMKGSFKLNSTTCKIVPGFSPEVNFSQIVMLPGTYIKIRLIQ